MHTIKLIALLLALAISYAQAQTETSTTNQSRTIEINNDNGDLLISFENGVITEFNVNGNPVPKERYDDYQDIIDNFSPEDMSPPSPPAPSTAIAISPPAPTPPSESNNQPDQLHTAILGYLKQEGIIRSEKKYNIRLKSKSLKVNGKKMTQEIHNKCLDLFDEVYGQELNSKCSVKFKKSGSNFSSSVSIVD